MSQEPAPTRIFDLMVLGLALVFLAFKAYSSVAVSLLAPEPKSGLDLEAVVEPPILAVVGVLILASAVALVRAWRARQEAGKAGESLSDKNRGAPLGAAVFVVLGVMLIGTVAGSLQLYGNTKSLRPVLESEAGVRVGTGSKEKPVDAPPMASSFHASGAIVLEPAPDLRVNGAVLDQPRLIAPGDVVRFKGQDWTARPPEVRARTLFLFQLTSVGTQVLILLVLAAIAFPGLPALGLGRTPVWPEIKRGLWGYLAFLPLMAIAGLLVPLACKAVGLHPVPHAIEGQLADPGPLEWGLAVSSACVAAPLWEEILFRGLLLGAIARLVQRRSAIAISAGLFAVVHVGVVSVLPLFIFGLFLAFLTAKSPRGSIIAAITAHALHNILVMTLFALSRL